MMNSRVKRTISGSLLIAAFSIFGGATVRADLLAPASSIELKLPAEIRAGANLEYTVIFNGKSDVTDQAKLRLPFRAEEKEKGLVLVRPDFRTGSEWVDISAEWTEKTRTGDKVYTAKKRIRLTWDPEWIKVVGPANVGFGGVVTFTATGMYRNSTLDLSHGGTWFSQFGEITHEGVYTAPKTGVGSFDWIQFQFGSITESSRIQFY